MDIAYALQDLLSTKPAIRLKAVREIEKTGARVVTEHLVRLLRTDEVEAVRAECARVLGALGDPLAVEALAERMAKDTEEVAFFAADSLARIDGDAALSALAGLTRDRGGALSEQAFFWAVQTLARFGQKSLPALVELFASPSWTRRRVVADAVGKIGRAAEGALLNALRHENADVRFWVCQSLGRVGSHEAVERLRAHLDDPNKDVRFAAVTALGEIGSQAAIRYLKESLKSGRKDIRMRSLEILGRMGTDVVESLVDCLADDSWLVRDQAAKSVAKLGRDAIRPLLHAYETGNEDIRINAVKAFCFVGEEAVDALLRALDDRYEPVCLKAVEGLAKQGARIVPRLLEYFHTASVNGKRYALRVMGRTGDPAALEHILRSAASDDATLRLEAAHALEPFADGRVTETLVRMLEDPADGVREAAAEILARARNLAGTVAALVACLSGENWILRSSAAQILGRIGKPAIPALYEVLSGGDDDARFWAIRSLGSIGPTAIDPLVGYLGDKSWIIRKNAAEALIEIGDEAARPLLRKLESVEEGSEHYIYWAEYVLSALSGEIRRHLLAALNKPGVLVRAVAVRSLARMPRSEETDRALLDALKDEATEVRLEAVRSLGATGKAEAVPVLVAMYDGADAAFRREILKSLGAIGGKEATRFLLERLGDDSWLARRESLAALARHAASVPAGRLVKLLADPVDAIVEAAIPALAETGSAEAAAPIVALLSEGKFESACLAALAALDPARHELHFHKYAGDPDHRLRAAAARGLGKAKGKKAQGALYALLNDEFWLVRKAAAEALSGFQSLEEERLEDVAGRGGAKTQDAALDLGMELPTAEKYYRIALRCKAAGDAERALSAFLAALDLDPDYIPALCKLGLLYEERGEVELAIARFKRAVAIQPEYAPARVYLGIAYGLMKDIVHAEQELRAAIEIDADSESARIAGNILKRLRKPKA